MLRTSLHPQGVGVLEIQHKVLEGLPWVQETLRCPATSHEQLNHFEVTERELRLVGCEASGRGFESKQRCR